MIKKLFIFLFPACLIMFELTVHQDQKNFVPAENGFVIDTLARDLVVPWQIVFLPDQTMLFTERPGRVRIFRHNELNPKPILTVQNVALRNKSGMLGLCIHPNFTKNKFVYLAHDYQQGNKMLLKINRYTFENDTLIKPVTILDSLPANQNHTGCRLVFGPDKKLYITLGDADQPILAQDLKAYNGKILRVNDDGTAVFDNPFFKNDTARKEIWTYGHRNCQGLAFEPGTNTLFNSEHGPTGGDEINIIKKGQNYGWPVIHHKATQNGIQSPLSEFTPSISPTEVMFYTGTIFPQLKDCLLVACLRGEGILKISLKNNGVIAQEMLLQHQYGRIRSVVTGPDGFIYFSTSQIDPSEGSPRPGYDMILRLRPSIQKNKIAKKQNLITSTTSLKSSKTQTPVMLYQQLCSSCHGGQLQGNGQTQNLSAGQFKYGADKKSIVKNITGGIPEIGMPAWNGAISKTDIEGIANFILQRSKRGKR